MEALDAACARRSKEVTGALCDGEEKSQRLPGCHGQLSVPVSPLTAVPAVMNEVLRVIHGPRSPGWGGFGPKPRLASCEPLVARASQSQLPLPAFLQAFVSFSACRAANSSQPALPLSPRQGFVCFLFCSKHSLCLPASLN